MNKFVVLLSFLILFSSGCAHKNMQTSQESKETRRRINSAKIVGLSEISFVDKSIPRSDLKIYVDLLSKDRTNIAAPAIFRFELYDYQPYITNKRGKRIFLWKDIDLRDKKAAQKHWRSIFNSYEFDLSLPVALLKKKYLLVATVIVSEKKRIETSYIIGYQNAH